MAVCFPKSDETEMYTLSPQRCVGVFWDIENILVPKEKTAFDIVQAIRSRFYPENTIECEFICVCDVTKQRSAILQSLVDAQVTVAHVPATCKNAADIKLAQSIRRFITTYQSLATIILLSSDINFLPDISDARYRHNCHVILIHNTNVSGAMLASAHHHINIRSLLEQTAPLLQIEDRERQNSNNCTKVLVNNLPDVQPSFRVASRLRKLSENCGGKVLNIAGPTAIMRFSCNTDAQRAKQRMDGQDVFGQKIKLDFLYSDNRRHRKTRIENSSTDSEGNSLQIRSKRQALSAPLKPRNTVTARCPPENKTSDPKTSESRKYSYSEHRRSHELSNGHSVVQTKRYMASYQESFSNQTVDGELEDKYSKAGKLFDDRLRLKEYIVHTLEQSNQFTLRLQVLQRILLEEFSCNFDLLQLFYFSDIIYFWKDNSEVYVTLNKDNEKKPTVDSRSCGKDVDPNYALPHVNLSLRILTPRIHTLIADHGGSLPLDIFPTEYEKHFESMASLLDEDGVSFEHLISCVPGVRISKINKRKVVVARKDGGDDDNEGKIKQINDDKLILLGSEITLMLSQNRGCMISLESFLDHYLCRYNKLCNPKDYGCCNLDDLLNKLKQIVQVLGSGLNRLLTLSHNVQVCRFVKVLVDLVKSENRTRFDIPDILALYRTRYNKEFDPRNYGLCCIEDLLSSIHDPHIKIERENGKTIISYYNENTDIKNLQHKLVRYIMIHHGCVSLSECSKRFPDCKNLTIAAEKFDKTIIQMCVTKKNVKILVLGTEFIRNWFCERLFLYLQGKKVLELKDFKLCTLGIDQRITFEHLGVTNLNELFSLFPEICKIEESIANATVRMNTAEENSKYISRLLPLVMDKTVDGGLDLDLMQKYYQNRYSCGYLSQSVIEHILKDMIVIYDYEDLEQSLVYLTPLYSFARDARQILVKTHSWITTEDFKTYYQDKFKQKLETRIYGKKDIVSLFYSISEVIEIIEHPEKADVLVKLKRDFRPMMRLSTKNRNRLAADFGQLF
ncbi:DgyrCDS3740 [Dimorphilus gyrociliatus]|uniref:DgyrCDS3740 n=1 Tax=Dimorphilus gyrociliatus TaxID=2664684 RepID=A0A7I8VE98_9ANNE|nr:DgyrCDS3740 [Dimorphilus gyrociliatus]